MDHRGETEISGLRANNPGPGELTPDHPAPFSESLPDLFLSILTSYGGLGNEVLDLFAGIGGVHRLEDFGYLTVGVELEPEWCNHPRTIQGDATFLPFADESFQYVVTSPCLEQSARLLTNDLNWVEAGDVQVGDELLAFDEHPGGITARGYASRRRWRRATVVRSVPRRVECVRVILANGDELITTPEHPWLANRYGYGGYQVEWVQSRDLAGVGGRGYGRGHRAEERQAYYVQKQLDPWKTIDSRKAGWLAGILDGEGSLSLGQHGAPKLTITQNPGGVLDNVEKCLTELGFSFASYTYPVREKKVAVFVNGGFPGILRCLGEIRPGRLLEKWADLDISSRCIEARKIQVVAVEPAGRRHIQEIETSEGTYIGEGYLMHNCFANRMADHHNAQDGSYRRTYRYMLGRELHPRNTGQLQWGPAYKVMHAVAWYEVWRVLRPGGVFVLDHKDHIRDHRRQHVTSWHYEVITGLGFELAEIIRPEVKGFKYGENRDNPGKQPFRLPEKVLVFVKPQVSDQVVLNR